MGTGSREAGRRAVAVSRHPRASRRRPASTARGIHSPSGRQACGQTRSASWPPTGPTARRHVRADGGSARTAPARAGSAASGWQYQRAGSAATGAEWSRARAASGRKHHRAGSTPADVASRSSGASTPTRSASGSRWATARQRCSATEQSSPGGWASSARRTPSRRRAGWAARLSHFGFGPRQPHGEGGRRGRARRSVR